MKNKLIILLLCMALSVSLTAGCTPGSSESSETTAATSSTTTETDPGEIPGETTGYTDACFAATTGGDVMGYNYNGVEYYLGIQYGTAERFQMPEPFTWDGLRNTMVFGEVAPQNTYKSTKNNFDFMNYTYKMVENEEKCLQLNVWTTGDDVQKPVIVWLHGGGFSSGASNESLFYEGANLAKKGDVVFVSINHRLNALGYLDLSAYGDDYQYSGNAGMADIVLALEWVQQNAAEFGGDAGNVTIIGQSGGGSKVSTLMGMPAAEGLFHRAASLSGGSVQVTRTTEQAQSETAAVVEELGLSNLTDEEIAEALSTIHYDELALACDSVGVSYGPVVDGDYYPDGTYAMSSDIPYMAGNVFGEFSTNMSGVVFSSDEDSYYTNKLDSMTEGQIKARYNIKYGDYADAIMEAFQAAYPSHNVADGLYINNRHSFFSALPLADAMDSYGGTAYNYVIAFDYKMFGGITPIHTASGVPFWFYNTSYMPAWIIGDEEAALKLADEMSTALVNFAYTGDPSQDGLDWENYTTENGACMVFDRTSEVRYNHDKDLMDLISRFESGEPMSGETTTAETNAVNSETGVFFESKGGTVVYCTDVPEPGMTFKIGTSGAFAVGCYVVDADGNKIADLEVADGLIDYGPYANEAVKIVVENAASAPYAEYIIPQD